ncbi:hypothetical protein D3C72_2428240 [compost metagenome]
MAGALQAAGADSAKIAVIFEKYVSLGDASKDNFSGVLQSVLSDDADKKAAWRKFLGDKAESGNTDAADLLKAANLK